MRTLIVYSKWTLACCLLHPFLGVHLPLPPKALCVAAAAAAAAAAVLGIRDHQEGVTAQVPVELTAALERLSLAVSRDNESIKVGRLLVCVFHGTSWPA